jgi:hypothetical protein
MNEMKTEYEFNGVVISKLTEVAFFGEVDGLHGK